MNLNVQPDMFLLLIVKLNREYHYHVRELYQWHKKVWPSQLSDKQVFVIYWCSVSKNFTYLVHISIYIPNINLLSKSKYYMNSFFAYLYCFSIIHGNGPLLRIIPRSKMHAGQLTKTLHYRSVYMHPYQFMVWTKGYRYGIK